MEPILFIGILLFISPYVFIIYGIISKIISANEIEEKKANKIVKIGLIILLIKIVLLLILGGFCLYAINTDKY